MTEADHVHDCTGADMRCPCGFVFTVARYSVSFDVCDRNTELVSDVFHSESLAPIIRALRDAADRLERKL